MCSSQVIWPSGVFRLCFSIGHTISCRHCNSKTAGLIRATSSSMYMTWPIDMQWQGHFPIGHIQACPSGTSILSYPIQYIYGCLHLPNSRRGSLKVGLIVNERTPLILLQPHIWMKGICWISMANLMEIGVVFEGLRPILEGFVFTMQKGVC